MEGLGHLNFLPSGQRLNRAKGTFGAEISRLLACHHADFSDFNHGDTTDPAFALYDAERASAAKSDLVRFYTADTARRLVEWFREDCLRDAFAREVWVEGECLDGGSIPSRWGLDPGG